MNNVRTILESLLSFYDHSVQAGHTRLMLTGVNNSDNAIVVVGTKEQASWIKRLTMKSAVSLHDPAIGFLFMTPRPMAWDNSGIIELLRLALLCIAELEKEIARLNKRDRVLAHLEENGVDNWENYSLPEEEEDDTKA